MTVSWVPPALIFIIGALLIPFFNGRAKQVYLLMVPVIAFIDLLLMSDGTDWVYTFLGQSIILGQVDKLSMGFGYIFGIMAFAGTLYALHVKEDGQHIAAFLYIGSSLGVVFAGDYLSLFVFWELMAFSSVLLVWYQKEKASIQAGFRYILVHVFGGLCLLGGIILYFVNTGSLTFGAVEYGSLASYLILIGFMLNAAVPPLSAWLPDAYSKATITGVIFLATYTTKTAVYVLLREFSGVEILVWLGAIMAVYGVFYAVLASDISSLLAYHIISQVGYMVAGIGIGTTMGMNGAVAHAFNNIFYKGLLFMGIGAVIHMTGKKNSSQLGGLYKLMPLTLILYMIGGFSISGVPLFAGFVSKTMVLASAAESHMGVVWLLLLVASSGTFLSTTLKLPYFTFFGEDRGFKVKDPPINMLLSMGFVAFLCILIGVYPLALYKILPYHVEFVPYTGPHITETLQVLLFTALGFFLLLKRLTPEPTISLDTDWFYRKGAKIFMNFINTKVAGFGKLTEKIFFGYMPTLLLKAADLWYSFIDLKLIDGIVNGISWVAIRAGQIVRKVQTGVIQSYATSTIIGIVALILILKILGVA